MTQVDTLSAPQIRERMSHPSIDGDGHLIEVREAFVRFVEDRGYGALLEEPSARALMVPGNELAHIPALEQRKQYHIRAGAR